MPNLPGATLENLNYSFIFMMKSNSGYREAGNLSGKNNPAREDEDKAK